MTSNYSTLSKNNSTQIGYAIIDNGLKICYANIALACKIKSHAA